MPILTGVVIGPESRWALFDFEGAPLEAQEGDSVGPLRVEAISAGEVVMRGPDGQTVWRVGNGTFVPPPEPERPSEHALHSRGQDGQHAE